ncbi:hypothetical protein S245_066322, partial [Arachis hypogaea]
MATMIAKGCSEGKASQVLYVFGEELNLPLPSTLSDPAENELRTGSSDDEDDNIRLLYICLSDHYVKYIL